jgi:hypothetical protein
MGNAIYQSVAGRVVFKAFLASDHVTPATGKTIPIVLSKNGGAFANPSAGATNATAIGSGWYYVDLSTTDRGTLGPLIVRGTEATIDDAEAVFEVISGHRLAADGLDLIVIETGVNARQAMSPILAAAGGVLSGAGTTSITIKGGNTATNRIVATVDADGNRSAVTLTLPT